VCARLGARKTGKLLRRAFENLDTPGHHWQLLTLTVPYDARDDDGDLSVQGIRKRIELCSEATRKLWRKQLKAPGAAMRRAIQCSKRGHVHMHCTYFGPTVDKDTLSVNALDCSLGAQVDVRRLDHAPDGSKRRYRGYQKKDFDAGEGKPPEDPRGDVEAVVAAGKYAEKGIEQGDAFMDESWQAGEISAVTADPRLVARWELAATGLHLNQSFGALRNLPETTDEEIEQEAKVEVAKAIDFHPCGGCGVVGEFEPTTVPTHEYLHYSHDNNRPAYFKSRWQPPPSSFDQGEDSDGRDWIAV